MNSTETTLKMIFDRWYALLKKFDASLNALTDEQLQHEIAPGKNRGIYLLGHTFINSPDKTASEIPAATELRAYWSKQNEVLKQKFDSLQPDEWFQKHTAVTAEDFAKEPHRNKLNIIITRTTHLAYHHGQFVLIR